MKSTSKEPTEDLFDFGMESSLVSVDLTNRQGSAPIIPTSQHQNGPNAANTAAIVGFGLSDIQIRQELNSEIVTFIVSA